MNEKKRFHVTITDNETGEVLHDTDAHAIVAGIGAEGGAGVIGCTACDKKQLAVTIQAAEDAVRELYACTPGLHEAVLLHRLLTAASAGAETRSEETENN